MLPDIWSLCDQNVSGKECDSEDQITTEAQGIFLHTACSIRNTEGSY